MLPTETPLLCRESVNGRAMVSDTESESGGLDEALNDTLIGGREANALAAEYPDESALVSGFREGDDLADLSGVGGTTANRVFRWAKENHPEAWRARLENDEAYCTEFRSEVDLLDDERDPDGNCFAFVCPRCNRENPLKGDPGDFRNRAFTCIRCRWVCCLAAEFIDEFADEQQNAGVGCTRDPDGPRDS